MDCGMSWPAGDCRGSGSLGRCEGKGALWRVGWLLEKLNKNWLQHVLTFWRRHLSAFFPFPEVHILIIPQRCSIEALTTADALVLLGGRSRIIGQ